MVIILSMFGDLAGLADFPRPGDPASDLQHSQ
jgi:hypothetical protein